LFARLHQSDKNSTTLSFYSHIDLPEHSQSQILRLISQEINLPLFITSQQRQNSRKNPTPHFIHVEPRATREGTYVFLYVPFIIQDIMTFVNAFLC
jgi:hypothetical protein